MAKLEGWRPRTRQQQRARIHEEVPRYVADADEWFSWSYIDRAVTLTTRGKLLDRFYVHADDSGGNKPWLVMRLDPHEQQGIVPRHIWYWGHRRDYYAIAELSYHGTNKVHRTRLYYRQETGGVLWLASAQLGPVLFYSAEKVAVAYYNIIANREWHMPEAERDKVVVL